MSSSSGTIDLGHRSLSNHTKLRPSAQVGHGVKLNLINFSNLSSFAIVESVEVRLALNQTTSRN